MGTVGSCEAVKLFPLGQFGVQIDIARVAEQLVELPLVGSVGSFDLAVESRRVPTKALSETAGSAGTSPAAVRK